MNDTDPLEHQPLFAEAATVQAWPAPLAGPLLVLLSELRTSGEATTADETSLAIEAFAAWMGRVWVAEYLHALGDDASVSNEALNRDLRERLASGRPTLTGQWVGLWRRCRNTLKGRSTVIRGLDALSPGEPGDGSPLDRLLRFRNHFSHGSFATTVLEIRAHRQLLHDCLDALPALRDQPVLCRDPETGRIQEARGAWPESPSQPEDLAVGHPTIVGEAGQLDLYPLLAVRSAAGGLQLVPPGDHLPPAELLQHPALGAWIARYDRERLGHLPYPSPHAGSTPPDPAHRAALAQALSEGQPGLVLIEAHPGSGTEALVRALTDDDPAKLGLDRFGARRRVSVHPGELGQSGSTVTHVILRATEEALGETEGTRGGAVLSRAEAQDALEQAARDLASAKTPIVIGLDGLHRGQHPYRGEPFTVLEVYTWLASTAVCLVATTHPGALNRPLFDRRLTLATPEQPDTADIERWLRAHVEPDSLNRRVLTALTQASAPLHLFALCDRLEHDGGETVFEPAVERALWDLQPVLQWRREPVEVQPGVTERVRLWSSFHPSVRESLTGGRS